MRIALKLAVFESGQSQRQIAAAAHVAENRFSDIVREWRQPSDDERARIAAALGVPVEQLFEGVVSEPAAEHQPAATANAT